MSRGNGKMRIFLDDTDYRRFLYLLAEVLAEFSIRCWNYCLMPNHYHLTIQPALPNLSQAIGRLNGGYGLWWNHRHGQVGHVFQGRFKDQVVDREEYLVTLSRYVVMNPVRAGLVQRPQDWRWSSYRATAGLCSAPAFLDTTATLDLFSANENGDSRVRFASAISDAEGDLEQIDRIRSNERVLGPQALKQQVENVRQRRLASASDVRADPGLDRV
jgi:putative transposase